MIQLNSYDKAFAIMKINPHTGEIEKQVIQELEYSDVTPYFDLEDFGDQILIKYYYLNYDYYTIDTGIFYVDKETLDSDYDYYTRDDDQDYLSPIKFKTSGGRFYFYGKRDWFDQLDFFAIHLDE